MADKDMHNEDMAPQFQPGVLDMGVDAPVNLPVGRLDADQYSADDLDGVTESVFGSGNMAYASLQASQTDAALMANEAADLQSDIFPEGRDAPLNTDRPLEIGDTGGYEAMGTQGHYANATVGSLGASALSSDVGSFSPESNLKISGENFFKGGSGSVLTSKTGGDVSRVENSEVSNTYNESHSSSTNTNIYNEYNKYIDNLLDGDLGLQVDLNLLDTVGVGANVPLTDPLGTDLDLSVDLDPALNLAGNIADLTGVAVVGEALDHLGGVTDATQDAVDQVTDLVTDLDLRNLDATVEQAADLIANLDDTALNVVQGAGDSLGGILEVAGLGAGDNTPGDTLDSTAGDLAAIMDTLSGGATNELSDALTESVDTVTDVVDDLSAEPLDDAGETLGEALDFATDAAGDLTGVLDEAVDPVTDVVDEIAGDVLDTDSITGALGLDGSDDSGSSEDGGLLGGLFGGGAGSGETDNGASEDVPPTDTGEGDSLDAVENLLGDIDLGFDNDTGAPGETDNTQGDSDVGLDTGVDLIDNTIVDAGVDTTLDGLENAGSDNDLDIGLATDILGAAADPIVNDGEGGNDEGGLLADLSDELADTANDLLDGDNSAADIISDTASDDFGSLLDDVVSEVEDTVSEGADLLADATDIAGDVDLGDALDLLGGDTTDAADDISESTDTSWTESTIDDTGGLFDDVISGDSGSGDILPDPSGTVGEGLGILDTGSDGGGGGLGGLFG